MPAQPANHGSQTTPLTTSIARLSRKQSFNHDHPKIYLETRRVEYVLDITTPPEIKWESNGR